MKFRITVFTENTAGSKFLAEHGLSYLVETDDEKILFDTGHSDVFLKNALKMGIDIQTVVNTVVLSHGHLDHGDGLRYIENKTLITHPSAFMKRFRKAGLSPVGLSLSKNEILSKFNVTETKTPLKITENLWYLGEIPRENNFEAQTTAFTDDAGDEDFIPDDSALAAVISNQLVVITGCSHSGICNICEYAKKITGTEKIKAVLGGFHLKHNNLQTQKTIAYFKENKVKNVYPSHCTELAALAAFQCEFEFKQVKTGNVFEF